MLEDFIEANGLKAKIFPAIKSFNLIQCSVFEAGFGPVLVVSHYGKKIDFEKIKKAIESDSLLKIEGKDVEEITGYKEGFVPPISIYGIKVLMDDSLKKFDELNVLVGEEQTLAISPAEIESSNEDFAFVKF